jgi:2-polyprenyl-3-methyl-5-hydroxy-6-metoxy-1,4-benzoquinol methylase/GNAT superfamily N-acetyltransferase
MVYQYKQAEELADDLTEEYKYETTEQPTEKLLCEMSSLYSEHYGMWGEKAPDPLRGKKIKLSPVKIQEYVASGAARVVYAHHLPDNSLIGYVIAVQVKSSELGGIITWVTQLVIHREHRKKGVGRSLLYTVLGFSSHCAWGLLSSSPYAVRALEKATRRRCVPARIQKSKAQIMEVGLEHVLYIDQNTEVKIDAENSKVDTKFWVDTSESQRMILNVTTEEIPWIMGSLDDGWEWAAFTFKDQQAISLSADEINQMLKASDQVTKKAYARMSLNDAHKWTKHTSHEVEQVIQYCQLEKGMKLLDLGCGMGRHASGLASQGFEVKAVDYNSDLFENARSVSVENPHFMHGDCRDINLLSSFDAVICLYDVVGSYADESDNQKILDNIFCHLKPGGYALISVMNYELTKHLAKKFFSLSKDPDRLLDLPAGLNMQDTGNIFDPDFYIIEEDSDLVYRKEQFTSGGELPVELIIRDKRFSQDEIRNLCGLSGLHVVWSKFVRLGHWNEDSLASTDRKAKEILLLCKRPENH